MTALDKSTLNRWELLAALIERRCEDLHDDGAKPGYVQRIEAGELASTERREPGFTGWYRNTQHRMLYRG